MLEPGPSGLDRAAFSHACGGNIQHMAVGQQCEARCEFSERPKVLMTCNRTNVEGVALAQWPFVCEG